MKVVEGSSEVPVIYTAHHASHDFGEFGHRVALSDEQKIRFSDYGTDQTVPRNGLATIIAETSRALGDLNRDPDDHGKFQEYDYGKPERHKIWVCGKELSDEEKLYCDQNFYSPFHKEIEDRLAQRDALTFVVAWDNTAHYEIGHSNAGEPVTMKPFILSNRGMEESADPNLEEPTSCDPKFLKLLAKYFADELGERGLPNEVHLNLVMHGGYICRQYSSRRNRKLLQAQGINAEVQSLQLEYDTIITHDQVTLKPNPRKMEAIRAAFCAAIQTTFKKYQG